MQANPSQVAVDDLVAAEVDGMVGRQFARTYQDRSFPNFSALKPPLFVWQLLFDQVGFNGYTEMVGLAGEVGGSMVIGAFLLEIIVSGIAPENGGHAQIMGFFKCFRYFHDLPV